MEGTVGLQEILQKGHQNNLRANETGCQASTLSEINTGKKKQYHTETLYDIVGQKSKLLLMVILL